MQILLNFTGLYLCVSSYVMVQTNSTSIIYGLMLFDLLNTWIMKQVVLLGYTFRIYINI